MDKDDYYRSVYWGISNSEAIVDNAISENNYYAQGAIYDNTIFEGTYLQTWFMWIPSGYQGTISGNSLTIWHSKEEYKSSIQNELTIATFSAPPDGILDIKAFRYDLICIRNYWMKDPLKRKLFAEVKGRKDLAYEM